MLSSTLAAVAAPSVTPGVHLGVSGFGAGVSGSGGTVMPSVGTCVIPGYPTVLRARTAAAAQAKADNDVWGFLAWSPPV